MKTMTKTAMDKLDRVARYKILRQHHGSQYIIASTLTIDKAHSIAENDALSMVDMANDAFPIMTQVWYQDNDQWECIEQFTAKVTGVIFEYLPE